MADEGDSPEGLTKRITLLKEPALRLGSVSSRLETKKEMTLGHFSKTAHTQQQQLETR